MKRILSLSLAWLLLFQLSTHAQTDPSTPLRVTINLPDSLAGKNWVKNLVREELKKVGTTTPTTPTTPVVKLDPCPEGPVIKSVTNVSVTYLNATFHGDGVFKIAWWIRDVAGKAVREGEVDPENNTPGITYNTLPAGNYVLVFQGKSCESVQSTHAFTIPASVGVVVPPVLTNPGLSTVQTIASGMPEHLNLEFKRDGDSYLITDLANPDQIGGDYEYRYMIGSDIVTTGKSLLSNYRLAGVNPGRVVKYKIKPGKVLNNWVPGDPAEKDRPGYYSGDAAEPFSFNTSVAYHTFSFPGASGDFVNPIPASYDPATQTVQWADITPDFQLPSGHVYVAGRKPWPIDLAFQKGVTHISNFQLPWEEGPPYKQLIGLREAGKSYNDVPRIETVLGITKSGNSGETWPDGTSKDWWPKGAPTYEEGYQMGLRANIDHAIFIGEFSENQSWLPPSSIGFKGFYAAYMPRMKAHYGDRGIPYLVAHDYLTLGGPSLNDGLEKAKNYLRMSPGQMPKTEYSPGGTLSETTLRVETVYLASPDLYGAQPYSLAFKLTLYKQMGYEAGGFLAGVHEWWPTMKYKVKYAEGDAYISNKLVLDPSTHIANVFLSHVYGKVFVEWGANGKTEKKVIDENWAHLLWYPKGATQPQKGFPYFSKTGEESYYGYTGSADLTHFAHKLFADTYAKVEGGKDKYLRFRIDSGAWVTPEEHDFIAAFYQKRGFVHSRTLAGRTALFYITGFSDNSFHKLEVELPDGSIWSGKVAGNGIHAKLL